MKVFISLPMKGLTEDQILRNRKAIMDKYHISEKDVIDTIHKENVPANATAAWYLGNSISQMSESDLVIFAEDWDQANGCLIEHMTCLRYDIPFIIDERVGDRRPSRASYYGPRRRNNYDD